MLVLKVMVKDRKTGEYYKPDPTGKPRRCQLMAKKKKATSTRLDPKCWSGYKKSGTKVKGGTRVNNCVKIKK